jgi:hypothetical protein
MPERFTGLSRAIQKIAEFGGGNTLKQFRTYNTRLQGIDDYRHDVNKPGKKVLFVGESAQGEKVVMSPDHFEELLKKCCWIEDPRGTRQGFWKLSEGIKNHDLGIREMSKEVFYFYGAKLFAKVGGKEVEVQQVGYGFDFGGIHYVQSATIKPSGGDWGSFDKKLAADFVTNKSGVWGRIKDF